MTEQQNLPRALIFGHSHVWAYKRAIGNNFPNEHFRPIILLCGTEEFPGSTYLNLLNGNQILNPAILSNLSRVKAGEDDWIISMAQGNYYNQASMVIEGRGFDVILPDKKELPVSSDLILLPYEAVKRMLMEKYMNEMPQYVRLFSRLYGGKKCVIVGAPPPPFDETEINKVVARTHSASSDITVSPPWVRLKMWHLQNHIMATYCAKRGVRYIVGTDPAVTDDMGFLRPEFVKDAVHANHGYAAIMLNRIGGEISSIAEGKNP